MSLPVQITMHYHPLCSGGQQIYVEELRKIFAEMGMQSLVIQPKRGGSAPEWVCEIPQARGLWRLSRHAPWFWFTFRLNSFRRTILDAKIAIVHYPFHLPGMPRNSKSIIVSHGVDWPECPVKYVDHYKRLVASYALKMGIPTVANDTDYFRRMGLGVRLGHKPYSMVNSHAWYIPNAVDTRVFKDLGLERKNVILVPRNLRWSRGIHLAIEAFQYFQKRNRNFELWIAGGQTKGRYYEYCTGLVLKYDLRDSVTFLGEINHERMIDLYQKCAVTLIPTLAFEGTSYSALEAMACGSVTLSTTVGGLADLPTEKTNTDPEEVAKGLEGVISKRLELAKKQRSLVVDSFDIVQWRAAWKSVFEWRMEFGE